MKQLNYLLFSIILMSLNACATNPASKGKDFVLMSEKEELSLGLSLAKQYNKELPLLDKKDPLAVYVNEVGQRVAAVADRPELFYRFRVVDDVTINAFALPGGHIYIHRGLLNHLNSEAELAAVLGHEIGHVTARHAVQRYTQIQAYQLGMFVSSIFVPIQPGMSNLTNLLAASFISGFGREQELQSDQLALRYAPLAGYDPYAVVQLLATLKRLENVDKKEKKDAGEKIKEYHGAFASHPETQKRILQSIQQAKSSQKEGLINHQRMLVALDGYPYGDSPSEGAVVGQRFLHPELNLQLEFPNRWVIKNASQALTARIRQEKVYFELSNKSLSKRRTAAALLEAIFPKRHIENLTSGSVMGYPSAHARIKASAPHVSKAYIDATVWLKGSEAFIITMWAPRADISQYEADFSSILDSLKKYNEKESGGIPRIALHVWKKGDSWPQLAKQSKSILGRFTAERIAILNGMDLTQIPKLGTIIKTVQ
ncbi:MAG: M48 family metalloprotease [Mariprofundaceae bacterium]|nr:M48 family metalloprotease [Mariprofundaceae bacterium]